MKKLKTIFFTAAAAFAVMACTASSRSLRSYYAQPQTGTVVETDSVSVPRLGDSIASVIKNAEKVTARLIAYGDTAAANAKTVELSPKRASDLKKILVTDRENSESDKLLFGRFLPNISFYFQNGEKVCTVFCDFGLRKWQVKNAGGEILHSFDLKSKEILQLAGKLFPEDEYISEMLKTKNK